MTMHLVINDHHETRSRNGASGLWEFSHISQTILFNVHNQPVGKRPFPFGGRSAIVIRQDMSPHVQALLQ